MSRPGEREAEDDLAPPSGFGWTPSWNVIESSPATSAAPSCVFASVLVIVCEGVGAKPAALPRKSHTNPRRASDRGALKSASFVFEREGFAGDGLRLAMSTSAPGVFDATLIRGRDVLTLKARYSGLRVCGRIWTCPVCARTCRWTWSAMRSWATT